MATTIVMKIVFFNADPSLIINDTHYTMYLCLPHIAWKGQLLSVITEVGMTDHVQNLITISGPANQSLERTARAGSLRPEIASGIRFQSAWRHEGIAGL